MEKKAATDDLDAPLIAAIADGDEQAFVRLVGRYHQSLTRFLRKRIRNGDDVEDVVQETFINILKGASSFSGVGTGRGWIFGVARRSALRAYRKHVDEPAEFESLESLGALAGWGDPEAEAMIHERLSQVDAALAGLPSGDAEVILLRDVEGLTGPEVAEALNLELPAMKSRLHRARLKLMAELRKPEYG